MTMHVLYQRYGAAFDCAKLARELSTLEHGVSEFAAFCWAWPKVCALLETPCTIEELGERNIWVDAVDAKPWSNVGNSILTANAMYEFWRECIAPQSFRVVLLDGTVVREWPAQ
jgi:hypothetical protein